MPGFWTLKKLPLIGKVRFSVRPGKPFLRPRLLPISHRESGGQGWPLGHRASGAERGLEGREHDGMLEEEGAATQK